MPLSKYAGYDYMAFDNISKLLDVVYMEERTEKEQEGKEKEEELKKSAEEQKRLAKEYKEKAELYRMFANKIYEHMGELNEIIEKLRKGESATGEEFGIRIGRIDKKTKTVEVDIP